MPPFPPFLLSIEIEEIDDEMGKSRSVSPNFTFLTWLLLSKLHWLPNCEERAHFGWLVFYSYYLVSAISTTRYSLGSAYVASGLSAGETIGAVFTGCCFAALNAFFGVQVGLDKSLGFVRLPTPTLESCSCC